jgi:DMSO/TMAO reductase YedYZ molybdopterin-dependent catalytic subunit
MSSTPHLSSIARSALAGVIAGAVALGVGELIAGFLAPTPSLVTGVANRVIEESPAWLTDFGKRTFGTNQKTALVIGTIILAGVFAAILGIASRRRPTIGAIGIAAFGILGMVSIGGDPQGSLPAGAIIAVGAIGAGVATLFWLLAADQPLGAMRPATISAASAPARRRRSFLQLAAGTGLLAALSSLGGRGLRSRSSAEEARAAVDLSAGGDAVTITSEVESIAAGDIASTPGITPIVIPNSDFYRIDTAIVVPQVNPDNWVLTIDGMVDQPLTLTFDDLVAEADLITPVTLSCVSNEVGGGLVGNAVWQGVPLTRLLDRAGVQPGATQIASRSVDGWTCGFPTDLAYDGRTAMVAIAMNDEALPLEHGFPARLVVSGLYGYVSATKWLDRISLTTLEDFDGYWIVRNWDKDGPVKTQSRIDTPRRGERVERDVERSIAGVTWAPNIGIRAVEVQVDDGPWLEAELGESLGINAWRQWRVRWTPTNEDHRIRVRATDETGETQTEVRSGGPRGPNGATGWHTIEVKS